MADVGVRSTATLVIIPARGGSRGIPRKNLRSLGGEPLISYAIRMALASRHAPDVYVTTDDGEIAAIAGKLGARVHIRDSALANDEATLDGVVHDAYLSITHETGMHYDVVATVQPTSPLLRTASLDAAIDRLRTDATVDTVISAAEDTHLTWTRVDDRFVPNYEKRLNRQFLPAVYRETGGFLIARAGVIRPDSRIGERPTLHVLSGAEAIDIDTKDDFSLCEWHLARRNVLFVVAGYPEIGLGHVYNALTIATDLVRHDLTFLVDRRSGLAADLLAKHNYQVVSQGDEDLLNLIASQSPDVVINDVLDTDADYILALKKLGAKVVNFEDLGDGARHADLVINAIYPEREILPNHYFGPKYFCARSEFTMTEPAVIRDDVGRVLITFGGTDPNNLTAKVLGAIDGLCRDRGIAIDVILGTGYSGDDSLKPFPGAHVYRSVPNMSDHVRVADVIFTSAGRTVFEIACIGTPAIVLAQNAREMTHFFASEEHGFLHLGLGAEASEHAIRTAFSSVVESAGVRHQMHRLMLDNDLRTGKERVLRLIEEVVRS